MSDGDTEAAASEGMIGVGRMITKLRSLPHALTVELMPEVAEVLSDDLHETISAGTTPDGVPWAPRKKDGSRPLVNAQKAVTVFAQGGSVYVKIKGIEQKHHWGAVRGGTKRQIIYAGTQLPARVVAKITALAEAVFQQHMNKGSEGENGV